MRETGLFDLLENHIVNNLVDYATGVETGLDSNGRKNRGGHLMEDLVESFINKAGFVKDKTYFKEMYIHQITAKWGIDLSAISNQGKMEKRFDFVVKTPTMIYGIETKLILSTALRSFGLQTARDGQAQETTLKKLLTLCRTSTTLKIWKMA